MPLLPLAHSILICARMYPFALYFLQLTSHFLLLSYISYLPPPTFHLLFLISYFFISYTLSCKS